MLWELRLRTPRRIDDVVIETDLDTEDEAKRLAEAYIASLASPSTRFIYVRRLIVARSKDFPRTEADTGPEKTARRPSEPLGRVGA
jgi:hypothetical protein